MMVTLRRKRGGRKGGVRAARGTVFGTYPSLFLATAVLLLALLALAAVHELIPGLCLSDGKNDDACPFCKLVHALVLVGLAFVVAFCMCSTSGMACALESQISVGVFSPAYLLRAPPVR